MKKNLAKKVTLSILAGAVLMSSGVVWASVGVYQTTSSNGGGVYEGSLTAGDNSLPKGADAQCATVVGIGAYTGGNALNSVVLGFGSTTNVSRVVSVGAGGDEDSTITLNGEEYIVPNTRRIVNVAAGVNANDAVNKGQLEDALTGAFRDVDAISYESYEGNGYDKYAVSVETLKNVLGGVQAINDATYVKIKDYGTDNAKVVISEGKDAQVTFEDDKVIFGENSSWYEADKGFFAGGDGTHNTATAKAALKEDGGLMGASGKFIVDSDGNLGIGDGTKATFAVDAATGSMQAIGNVNIGGSLVVGDVDNAKFAVDSASGNVMANDVIAQGKSLVATANQVEFNKQAIDGKADKATTLEGYGITDAYTKAEVDSKIDGGSASIAGLNQRLEKTNAKINKVGAGAAALAALHPLDYDPDDKLTFSAGMGNYAGENAAALGAFYRPNEKFMLSLGGSMGNGENMVNLGLSIGLDKANGFAKMSKRELIQEVNAVKAENEAMKAEMAEMKAMLQELLAKK